MPEGESNSESMQHRERLEKQNVADQLEAVKGTGLCE